MSARLLIPLLCLAGAAAQNKTGGLPADPEIRKILQQRIVPDHQGVGIAIGLIDPAGRRVVAQGTLAKNDKREVNGDTVFEIGSITKVFTSLLLADMVQRGEVGLSDPVAKFLPATYHGIDVKVPERAGRKITLVDLATHTSGLPRLPTNLVIKNPANPYADYTVEDLYRFLAGYELTRDIGSRYEYSNLGGGLLGHVLALRAGRSYEALVKTRICEPLGMKSTGITLTPEMQKRLATGHNDKLEPVSSWDLPALAGAGALRSTANDMLKFLAANLGYVETPLAPAMAAMLKLRKPTGNPGLEIALGWHILTREGTEIVWHNGGTGGYRSFAGFVPSRRTGLVILSNTSLSVDELGYQLLSPRRHVTLDPKVLESYTGNYQLAPGVFMTITREGNRLFAQVTGQSRVELFAEDEKNFFLTVVDARVTFETGEAGRATQLVLHQGGRDMPAKRVEGSLPAPKQHKEVSIDPKLLDRYVGKYELAPGFVLTITREGDRLHAQATGQPAFEIFPESDRDFFLKAVDAQLTFEAEGDGKAARVILHQNGRDVPGKRIE